MEERNQRDREVQEKKALVEQRVAMNKKLEEHQKKLKQQQDAEKPAQAATRDLAMPDFNAGASGDYANEERQKLEDYEGAFHQIKDATGIDDVNEVIQKFLTQEDTQKNFNKLTKENLVTVDKLTEEKRKIRLQVEELKFCGTTNRRQAIDEQENRLTEATEKLDRNRAKFERMGKMLIDMKAGIDHIGEKLAPIKLENETTLEMSDETVEEVLQQCELKVLKLLSLTQATDEDSAERRHQLDNDRYEERLMLRNQADVRVKLTDKDDDGDDEDDAFDEEMDDDVSHRKQVKYNSEQILEKQQTKNRKKGKTNKAAAPAAA